MGERRVMKVIKEILDHSLSDVTKKTTIKAKVEYHSWCSLFSSVASETACHKWLNH